MNNSSPTLFSYPGSAPRSASSTVARPSSVRHGKFCGRPLLECGGLRCSALSTNTLHLAQKWKSEGQRRRQPRLNHGACLVQALLHIGRQIVLLLGGNVNKSVAQVNALLLSNMVQEIDEQGLLLDGQRNTTLVAVQRASPRIKVVISGV